MKFKFLGFTASIFLSASILIANPDFPNIIDASSYEIIAKKLPENWPTNGLIVFPEMNRKPWIDAIQNAKINIYMGAYRLEDPEVINVLTEAAHKKIEIHIILEKDPHAHDSTTSQKSPLQKLEDAGIHIHYLSEKFNQSHYKTIIIDENWGMISTGNLDKESIDGTPAFQEYLQKIKSTSKDLSEDLKKHYETLTKKSETSEDNIEKYEAYCRDFAITLTDKKLVQHVLNVLQSDIAHHKIVSTHPQIIFGPDEQRSTILRMINSAKKSIKIYQQDIQDKGVVAALADAAKTINVEIIMMPFPFNKNEDKNVPHQNMIRQAGGQVYLHHPGLHYIHAKAIVIDAEDEENCLMYIGSANFYPTSLDGTRELGVLTQNISQIKKVCDVFNEDRLELIK